jgi:probable LLM family oxidoreductase
MELGIYTFVPADARSPQDTSRKLRELMDQVELADQLGLEVFGVGEHHRPDFAVSAPAVVLAAAAERTKRIRLTSAVTVLSSDDPVRVFEEFSILDLLSGGRAEIMAGRGSFIESFPLFGYDLDDYDALFAEKLEMLVALRSSERVTWSGKFRSPMRDLAVYPRPLQDPLPIWIAVGGNSDSAIRAGTLGLPMALAIIGGMPERFTTFAELHREAARRAGYDPLQQLSINSHGYIAPTYEQAVDESFPSVSEAMNRIGRERGWPPMSRAQYEAGASLRGAYFVGSPQQIIEKILFQYDLFHHDRFMLQFGVGPMEHEKIMRSIELFGTEVAPAVRAEVARRSETGASPRTG